MPDYRTNAEIAANIVKLDAEIAAANTEACRPSMTDTCDWCNEVHTSYGHHRRCGAARADGKAWDEQSFLLQMRVENAAKESKESAAVASKEAPEIVKKTEAPEIVKETGTSKLADFCTYLAVSGIFIGGFALVVLFTVLPVSFYVLLVLAWPVMAWKERLKRAKASGGSPPG